jgi:Uma2 family endonuclease
MATDARLTAKDLLRLSGDDVRRELVNGRVIEMPPHGFAHGEIAGRVYRRLVEHIERAGDGKVAVGDVGFVLSVPGDQERVRGPDVAFISAGRLSGIGSLEGFVVGAPDLAVEVLSPSDTMVDVQQRVRDYIDAGTELVWLVAPQARTVTVYRADGSAHLLRDQDVLDGEHLLPGLSIPLDEVFDG